MNLGSSDSDSFTYDPNTGRMTQYKFAVNSQSVTGNLGWNANGNLASLNITDPFNTADTQNCSYQHDDLSRISQVNCGSIWGQGFSYDAFGNITKSLLPNSGGTSFQPTYQANPAPTNRIAQLPGFTPTYDANGNSLSDGLHQYTWDSEGSVVTIDSVGLTYDALGRMIEQNRSGSYTQIVYDPTGRKLALMNGQSIQKAFVPLPHRGTAVYTSSGLSSYRHPDWLGSSRLVSTPNRTVSSTTAYSPFGETYAQSGSSDASFTGENQDTVAGLYDFLFREYNPSYARWVSPDPAGLLAADLADPQSFNRYTYVRNRPLLFIDPLGLTCVYYADDGVTVEERDLQSDPIECEANNGTWIDDEFVQCQEQYGTICSNVTDNMPSDRPPDVLDEFAGFDWLVARVYFEGLGRNFVDEFKQGGCVNVFGQAFNEGGSSHLIPDLPAGHGVDDAIRTVGQAGAATYAMNRALTVPLRSSVYRGYLEFSETAAAWVLVLDFFSRAVEGAKAEYDAFKSAECR